MGGLPSVTRAIRGEAGSFEVAPGPIKEAIGQPSRSSSLSKHSI